MSTNEFIDGENLNDFSEDVRECIDSIEENAAFLENEKGDNVLFDKSVSNIKFSFKKINNSAKWQKIKPFVDCTEEILVFVDDLSNNKLNYSSHIYDSILKICDILGNLCKSINPGKEIDSSLLGEVTTLINQHYNLKEDSSKIIIKKDNLFVDDFNGLNALIESELRGQQVAIVELWNFFKVFVLKIESNDLHITGKSIKIIKNLLSISKELSYYNKKNIIFSGLLYDLGMYSIPYTILKKVGKLTEEESLLVERHTSMIADPIRCFKGFEEIADGIFHHHERFDGTGYPDGLKGDEIPIISRILSVCDTFNAMLSNRPYRNKLSLMVVREEVNKCSETQFDPNVVSALNRLFEDNRLEY